MTCKTTVKQLLLLATGILIGGIATFAVIIYVPRIHPTTPALRPATAITMTLYPWVGVEVPDIGPVSIPPEEMDFVFRLLTPNEYYQHQVNDFIAPIIAMAEITHEGGDRTLVMVRDFGHNPAVVSVDGMNYFFARNDPDVSAGGFQLIRLVNQVALRMKVEAKTKP